MSDQVHQTEVHPDRAAALAQVPPHLHATADALAAKGFNWSQILAIIATLIQTLGPILSKPPAPPSS